MQQKLNGIYLLAITLTIAIRTIIACARWETYVLYCTIMHSQISDTVMYEAGYTGAGRGVVKRYGITKSALLSTELIYFKYEHETSYLDVPC